MNLFAERYQRIKNIGGLTLRKDFRFNTFSFLLLGLFFGAGLGLQTYLHGPLPQEPLIGVALMAGTDLPMIPLLTVLSLGILLSPCLQLVQHWDKIIILRLGKFRKVRGPGLFLIFPLADRIAEFIDTRIRATDFSAEKTLTRDTVPVHVDALTFWMIWDAKRAVLELENFTEAIVLSAQTALRDSIGKHNLTDLLSKRDRLGKEIQKVLDLKTNPWGITILSIEITDIIIPGELEDSMSKRAQAERESQSRLILGNAEVKVAEKFEEAARRYTDNPTALHLRAMNMVCDGLKRNGSLMILPSSALDSMSLGAVLGATALGKSQTSVGKTSV